MKFEVVYTQWSADGKLYGGGVHEVEKPSKKLLGLLAAAEDAGSVRIVEASRAERSALKGHVQTQADGEKAYAKAQADGSWHEGNRLQYEHDPSGFGGEG